MAFRLLFIGDVVGEAGREAVRSLVPGLRRDLGLDAVVANGENSAPSGRGITREAASDLLSVTDFLTLGNHAFDEKGSEKLLDEEPRIVRPANLPEGAAGRGWAIFEAGTPTVRVGVANVLGRVFMRQEPSSPFAAADRAVEELEAAGADLVVMDVHAEATSEKWAMGHHLAGRAQVVVGTHTHVPTADSRILPGGTAYATDVGMTGDPESVIGFDKEGFLGLFLGERIPGLSVAKGPASLNAVVVDLDVENRRATTIERVYVGSRDPD